jgi:hypothetical protein
LKGPEEMMQTENERMVQVQREWDGWKTAEVRLADLRDVHWFQPDRAPRPLLHGYISCSAIVSGEIPHECSPIRAPHQLLVCVLKSHTVPSAYMELARRADEDGISLHEECAVL